MKKLLCVFLVSVMLCLLGCKIQIGNDIEFSEENNLASSQKMSLYKIEYKFIMLSNNQVGCDWKQTVLLDNMEFYSGGEINVVNGLTILLQIEIIEQDKIPDIGNGEVELKLLNGSKTSTVITVLEGDGRYKGNAATWKFECCANLIEK